MWVGGSGALPVVNGLSIDSVPGAGLPLIAVRLCGHAVIWCACHTGTGSCCRTAAGQLSSQSACSTHTLACHRARSSRCLSHGCAPQSISGQQLPGQAHRLPACRPARPHPPRNPSARPAPGSSAAAAPPARGPRCAAAAPALPPPRRRRCHSRSRTGASGSCRCPQTAAACGRQRGSTLAQHSRCRTSPHPRSAVTPPGTWNVCEEVNPVMTLLAGAW